MLYKFFFSTISSGIHIPRSLRRNKSRARKFRTILLIYFNLFKKNTGKTKYNELPRKIQPRLQKSPFYIGRSKISVENALGIFSSYYIRINTKIELPVYKKLLSNVDYSKQVDSGSDHLVEVSRKRFIKRYSSSDKDEKPCYYSVQGPIKFLNHACQPYNNLELDDMSWSRFIVIHPIKINDELYIDYGENYFTQNLPCLNPICCNNGEK